MTSPLIIAPDGARALAALLARSAPDAQPTPALTPRFAALITDTAAREDPSATPANILAEVYTRRRQHAPSAIPGRAPAARFVRRQYRRWRVTQSADFTATFPVDSLARAGRRAQRRQADWPDGSALAVGVWHAFWAIDAPRARRDLLALLPLADARRVVRTPLERADAQRFWR